MKSLAISGIQTSSQFKRGFAVMSGPAKKRQREVRIILYAPQGKA